MKVMETATAGTKIQYYSRYYEAENWVILHVIPRQKEFWKACRRIPIRLDLDEIINSQQLPRELSFHGRADPTGYRHFAPCLQTHWYETDLGVDNTSATNEASPPGPCSSSVSTVLVVAACRIALSSSGLSVCILIRRTLIPFFAIKSAAAAATASIAPVAIIAQSVPSRTVIACPTLNLGGAG